MKRAGNAAMRILIGVIIQTVVFSQTVHDHREVKRKRRRGVWEGRYL